MKVQVYVLLVLCVLPSYCLRFEDILPIRHDVVKVRNEDEMQNAGNRNAVLDFIGLVERHGYKAEEHKLTTMDGYILILHRITSSPFNPNSNRLNKPVVFLQHGLFLSSDSFVLIGPSKDLPYRLADAGYDVWLGNARGNTYSRSHVFLSPREKKFWEYSYQEIGLMDLSSSIDYVLSVTGQQNLIYIGFSMGTTSAFVLLSALPEYNKKISLFVCLAPIAFWHHYKQRVPVFMQLLVTSAEAAEVFSNTYEYYEIMPQSTFMTSFSKNLCGDYTPGTQFLTCMAFFQLIAPMADMSRFNTSAFPTILSHFPAGTSIQSIMHYLQNLLTGDFQAYDHGPKMNYAKYGSKIPPRYNLKRITVPTALFFGNNDYFSTVKDEYLLAKSLPNVILNNRVQESKFNHLDFLWSRDVDKLVNDPLMELLSQHTCCNDV